ncbi:MAG TPA: efflux transporter outer membrane subunit [Rhizomicrobium sp.]|jgi:NodT family efflux transporter outer membrane factor (OMF) lipoprotein
MKSLSIVVLSSLLLTACVDAPSTTPSQVALKPAALGLTAAPAPQIGAAWWTAYNDRQLDALVDRAIAGSPTLAAAMARLRAAQSELSESRASTYPQASLDAQETRERFSKTYIIPPPYGGTTQWIGAIQANLSWDIDFWGRQSAMVDKARATANASALDAQAARLALEGAVTTAYIQLASAYRLADVAADAVTTRTSVLSLTNTRFRNGLENAASLKQAQAQLSEAREALTAANSNRELAVHALAALVGRGADMYGAVTRPTLDLQAGLPLPAALPADLLARRPDILAAQARIAAAVSGREVARTAFYPDVNLMGLVGWASIGLGPLFSAAALNYGAGPAIHLPIFDAGKLHAQYANATADLDLSVADYNSAVVGAVKQTADALTQSRALDSEMRDQREALEAAAGSFRIAQTRYRNGLSPQLNTLSAEDIFIEARRNAALLDGQAAAARVSLVLALGGGFAPATTDSHQDKSP